MSGPVAVVLKGYPRLSETFIAQELEALEKRGFRLNLYSLRQPTEKARHPVHERIAAPVSYLPEYLHEAPARVWRAWRRARRLSGYAAARRAFLKDLRRDPTRNRVRRFGQAAVLAGAVPAGTPFIYAHFLHTPASVARYAALMRQLPWAVSAHAKDIWTTPEWEKREKLAEARWAVTCTAGGRDHLAALAGDPERVHLCYHGLDLSDFPAPPERGTPKAGRPYALVSVGRLVEKKGYDDLLDALAKLPDDLDWRFRHIGGGDLSARLQAKAETLGIARRIEWLGALPRQRVIEALRAADLFVLASRIAADGDRDGLPNVLMEAQSQALACIATKVSAIPEFIEDGETGDLVPPGDVAALSAAIDRLLRDEERRLRLGQAGYRRLTANFTLERQIEPLVALFSESL